jgi:hypothetical protein
MTEQTRANGSLRHLLTLEGLTKAQLEALLTRAQKFVKPVGELPVQTRSLDGITVANMFTEPSTRTRVSFELAAKRLGADVVNLEVQLSSRVKGRKHARHHLHARSLPRGCLRDPRRRGRRARPRGVTRQAACERACRR